MKVTAITRFKNSALHQALRELNWSQAELARHAGVSQGLVGEVINLKRKVATEILQQIQNALGTAGVFVEMEELWPNGFKGLGRAAVVCQTADVSLQQLEDYSVHQRLLSDGRDCISEQELSAMEEQIARLPARDRRIIEAFRAGKANAVAAGELGMKRGNLWARQRTLLRRIQRRVKEQVECQRVLEGANDARQLARIRYGDPFWQEDEHQT